MITGIPRVFAGVARGLALLLAIAAAIDPSWTTTARGRAIVAVLEPPGSPVAARLRERYLVVRAFDAGAAAFVVVGDEAPAVAFPDTARIATVSVPVSTEHVRIVRIDAPASVPGGTAIRIEPTIAADPRRQEDVVAARINGVAVARAQHVWGARGDSWRAALDVVPIGAAPWVISVSVGRDARSVMVDRAPRIRVTFFEPRPSWTTTFVRRALERDGRFDVRAVTRLDAADAQAIVVGGLERVTEPDVAALEQFADERGGAVVALPDERIPAASPAARLVRARADEREVLLDRPAGLAMAGPLPKLAASEMLAFSPEDESDVLARSADAARPIVWTARRGAGRLLLSGALDAWRFRADADQAFDRFWRAAISSVALATPPLVDVTAAPAVARPLERVRVRVRLQRSMNPVGAAVEASLASGETVRLRPDAETGAFSGTFVAPPRDTVSRVDVAATSGTTHATGSARIVVRTGADAVGGASAAPDAAATVALLSETHRGIHVSSADLSPLDRWLRDTVSAPDVRAARRPMRSPWWMVPFAACLSIDWWITSSRRRRR